MVTIKEVIVPWNDYKIIISLVCRTINSNRRNIYNLNNREENIFWNGCQTDINNHAYTHCFGRNVGPIIFTLQQCKVSPFLYEYSDKTNI